MKSKAVWLVVLMALALVVSVGCLYDDEEWDEEDEGEEAGDDDVDNDILIDGADFQYVIPMDSLIVPRLASNPRYAVVLEAFYALDPAHGGGSNRTIKRGGGTWAVGDWNYLASDLHAWGWVVEEYDGYASEWREYFEDPEYYGFFGGYGRGGQCKGFANMIIYRSGVDDHKFPSYATWRSRRTTSTNSRGGTRDIPARCSRPGDVIWRSTSGPVGHTAIVVAVLIGNSDNCTVSAVDVVDSNVVSDNGYPDREVISRHIIHGNGAYLGEDLDKYSIYTGTSYYFEPYEEY